MSTKLNLLVTGSREYPRLEFVKQVIVGLATYPKRMQDISELFVGDARGVDARAAKVWRELTGRTPQIFKAEWKTQGWSAGPRRNIKMIEAWMESGGGIALAFWDGESTGTLHCMKELRKRDKLVLIPDGFQDLNKGLTEGTLRLRVWEGEENLKGKQ